MSILWTIIIGFLAGVVAKLLHPGKENMGFIMTTILGIVGSLAAKYAGQALGIYRADEPAGFIGAVIGALVLLIIYGAVRKKSA